MCLRRAPIFSKIKGVSLSEINSLSNACVLLSINLFESLFKLSTASAMACNKRSCDRCDKVNRIDWNSFQCSSLYSTNSFSLLQSELAASAFIISLSAFSHLLLAHLSGFSIAFTTAALSASLESDAVVQASM